MVKLDQFRNLVQDGGSLLLLKYEKAKRKPVDLTILRRRLEAAVIGSMHRKGGQEVSVQLSSQNTPCPIPWPSCCGSSLLRVF